MRIGKLIKGIGGFYYILSEGETFTLKAKKNLKHRGLSLMVGDDVHFSMSESDDQGWIEDIIPRRNYLRRPPVANMDILCIVISAEPKPDYNLVDLLLITAFKQKIKPIIVYNKCELGIDEGLSDYKETGVEIFSISAVEHRGLNELEKAISGHTACLAGQSGVGKSTLTNALLGTTIEIGDISDKIKRGRHTTRHVEIHFNGDIMLFDTPGFSAIELFKDIEPEEIQKYYPEFQDAIQSCFFKPCMHLSEPNCAVKAKLEAGKISQARMERYRELVAEATENRRNKYV